MRAEKKQQRKEKERDLPSSLRRGVRRDGEREKKEEVEKQEGPTLASHPKSSLSLIGTKRLPEFWDNGKSHERMLL